MELNSIEAIKNAVQSGLGAAFVSTTAIEKELEMNVLHIAPIKNVEIRRVLSVIINPNRYRSKASAAFIREVLPQFSTHPDALDPERLFANPYSSNNGDRQGDGKDGKGSIEIDSVT
jgi:hypothetical protein